MFDGSIENAIASQNTLTFRPWPTKLSWNRWHLYLKANRDNRIVQHKKEI